MLYCNAVIFQWLNHAMAQRYNQVVCVYGFALEAVEKLPICLVVSIKNEILKLRNHKEIGG